MSAITGRGLCAFIDVFFSLRSCLNVTQVSAKHTGPRGKLTSQGLGTYCSKRTLTKLFLCVLCDNFGVLENATFEIICLYHIAYYAHTNKNVAKANSEI